jgi:hypothetical protein
MVSLICMLIFDIFILCADFYFFDNFENRYFSALCSVLVKKHETKRSRRILSRDVSFESLIFFKKFGTICIRGP